MSLVLMDLDILLSLLMITLAIAGFLILNIVLNYCKYIVILQKWLKLSFPSASNFFDLIMLLNTLNMLSKPFCIPMALFVLSFSLPKFLLLFGAKLHFMLFMLLIAFTVLSSKIKLHMSAFLGHLQIIITFAPSVLLISFFFSHMSITNLSLGQGFVVLLAMAKLKRGIGVMILSLIVFVFPAMLSFRNIASLSSSLTSVPPYLPPLF